MTVDLLRDALDRFEGHEHVARVCLTRAVLIEATDIVPAGSEPYVGWSLDLAERIVAALEGR